MTLPAAVQRYLDKRGAEGPWRLEGALPGPVRGAIVIPSLAEADSLFLTLQSLAQNPRAWLARFLVIVVVNHGEQAEAESRQQNVADLARLSAYAPDSPLNLAWVDAASFGQEIPDKLAGVGFARKLGMDLALTALDWRTEPLLVCLDADTLVAGNYLETIDRHFQQSACGAAVLPYRHQPAADPAMQAAIERYELFLRSYVYGLKLAGSPYAFDTVGSAMACRAMAYVRCGGMNSRRAGEDFYFLQKIAKTDGVSPLSGTTVSPAPRISARVPFGTGRSMARLLDGERQAVLFYPVEVFKVLAEWLQAVGDGLDREGEAMLLAAEAVSPHLATYLRTLDWLATWAKIRKNHLSRTQRLQAFHAWFDGFRSLRLIHLLCENGHPRGEPQELLPGYFAWAGCSCPQTPAEMLEVLRGDAAYST